MHDWRRPTNIRCVWLVKLEVCAVAEGKPTACTVSVRDVIQLEPEARFIAENLVWLCVVIFQR
jgi:hypothetical protein